MVTGTKEKDLTADQENGVTSLAAAVFKINMLRRNLIKPGLHEKFTYLWKPSNPVTENLFGSDLTKCIKYIDEEIACKLIKYINVK